MRRVAYLFSLLAFLAPIFILAQQPKPGGPLSREELNKIVPAAYFFRGQSASVQLRNAAGLRAPDGKLVLAALVDTSGYAADVAEKYQGLLITEVKLNIAGSELSPGEYGFGFTAAGKFVVMDVGANDILGVQFNKAEDLHHAVPLQITADNGAYRLYAGKKWVSLKLQ